MTLVKVMTHPCVMDNNCVKLYPDRTREYEAMARTRCEQTDRQMDGHGDSYIPPPPKKNVVCGGIIRLEIKQWQHSKGCMCRLRNIAMRDYKESLTIGQTGGQTDAYVSLCFAGDTKMTSRIYCIVIPLVLSTNRIYRLVAW